MVHGDLAGWHWQTLSNPAQFPRAHWVHHPHGTRPHCCPAPLHIQSWVNLSTLFAQTAESSSSQNSTPEAYSFPLSWVGVQSGCTTGDSHLRWEAAHGVTREHWHGRSIRLPSKDSLSRFHSPDYWDQHDFVTYEPHVPRATEVQRLCNSANSVCCCSGKHLHWRISTKVLENIKNGPVQSY